MGVSVLAQVLEALVGVVVVAMVVVKDAGPLSEVPEVAWACAVV